MLRETFGLMRELPRLHEIASVFIRHGLGDFVQRIGIAGLLERAGRMLNFGAAADSVKLDQASRVRMALEELGPTFVKLGQVMATRVDLFPPRWIAELEKLPPGAVRAPARARASALAFRSVPRHRPRAYAAASRVHRASPTTPVVLKVRRPGVRGWIDRPVAARSRADRAGAGARRYRPAGSRRFALARARGRLRHRDAQHPRFARNCRRPHNHPANLPEWTSEVPPCSTWRACPPPTRGCGGGAHRKVLAARGVDVFLRMILVDGLFHADPHPGNVFYLPGNRMVVIDFGMVGRLSPQRRRQVVDLLAGLARMAEEPMLEVLLDWAGEGYVDETKLAADVNELVFDLEGIPLKDIRIGAAIRQFAAIVREHSIVLPSDLSLMFKTLIARGPGAPVRSDLHIVSTSRRS
jgi:ubiquinone biosynthesis protein